LFNQSIVQWFIGDQGMHIGAPQISCAVLPHITSDTPTYQLSPQFKGQALSIIQWKCQPVRASAVTLLTSFQGTSPFNYSMEVSISRDKPFQLFNLGVIQGTSPFNYSMEVPTGRGLCGHPAHFISKGQRFTRNLVDIFSQQPYSRVSTQWSTDHQGSLT
jgi:hypothetical protein